MYIGIYVSGQSAAEYLKSDLNCTLFSTEQGWYVFEYVTMDREYPGFRTLSLFVWYSV